VSVLYASARCSINAAWFIEFLAELLKKRGKGEKQRGEWDKEPSLREDNVLNCKENQSIILFSPFFFSSK